MLNSHRLVSALSLLLIVGSCGAPKARILDQEWWVGSNWELGLESNLTIVSKDTRGRIEGYVEVLCLPDGRNSGSVASSIENLPVAGNVVGWSLLSPAGRVLNESAVGDWVEPAYSFGVIPKGHQPGLPATLLGATLQSSRYGSAWPSTARASIVFEVYFCHDSACSNDELLFSPSPLGVDLASAQFATEVGGQPVACLTSRGARRESVDSSEQTVYIQATSGVLRSDAPEASIVDVACPECHATERVWVEFTAFEDDYGSD